VRARATPGASLENALAPRVALDLALPLPPERLEGGLAETVARALVRPAALALLRALTRGDAPARFRLVFRSGGHQRAAAWKVAELVRDAAPNALVNDPTTSTWEVAVFERGDAVLLELVPRGWEDRRFAYRTRTVPASSHPTIAAALARVSPRRDDDVVWDPFVGAGAELVERARLGPCAQLVGSDIDEGAVAAARANLGAAGVSSASVMRGDCVHTSPAGVTAIVSNPPMGRRVQRGGHLPLLERFVRHAGDLLPAGGSLTWIVPEPAAIEEASHAAGLEAERALTVDMGGFAGELMVLRKVGRRRG
jgi:23S rRNA G2445 N2-methylase RlmL